MTPLTQHPEDTVPELNQILTQITTHITSQARRLSDLALSTLKSIQVQFIDQETLTRNSPVKEP